MNDLVRRLRDRDASIIAHHERKLGKKLDVPFTLEGMAAAEIARLRAREDDLLRTAITVTWKEALADGSLPPAETEDRIVARAKRLVELASEQA